MANEQHLRILTQGVDAWNQWREAYPEAVPALNDAIISAVDLPGLNLRGAILSDTNLTRTNLSGASLAGAILTDAVLTGVNLTHADLKGANFTRANLLRASLHEATLWRTTFNNANLRRADLSYARLEYTDFRNADLSSARFTGANIVGLMNAAWKIDDAECTFIYQGDIFNKRRFPETRDFKPDEFERIYRSLAKFEFELARTDSPCETLLSEWLTGKIARELPHLGLLLLKVDLQGLVPVATFGVASVHLKSEAQRIVQQRYQEVLEILERDDYRSWHLQREIQSWFGRPAGSPKGIAAKPETEVPLQGSGYIELLDALELIKKSTSN